MSRRPGMLGDQRRWAAGDRLVGHPLERGRSHAEVARRDHADRPVLGRLLEAGPDDRELARLRSSVVARLQAGPVVAAAPQRGGGAATTGRNAVGGLYAESCRLIVAGIRDQVMRPLMHEVDPETVPSDIRELAKLTAQSASSDLDLPVVPDVRWFDEAGQRRGASQPGGSPPPDGLGDGYPMDRSTLGMTFYGCHNVWLRATLEPAQVIQVVAHEAVHCGQFPNWEELGKARREAEAYAYDQRWRIG